LRIALSSCPTLRFELSSIDGILLGFEAAQIFSLARIPRHRQYAA
jgi:hypothetical protein